MFRMGKHPCHSQFTLNQNLLVSLTTIGMYLPLYEHTPSKGFQCTFPFQKKNLNIRKRFPSFTLLHANGGHREIGVAF